jgi:predicted RNase H-like nuclease (RuvC/YqgF family)
MYLHDGVTELGDAMRAQRVWRSHGTHKNDAEIERLHLQLGAFNKQIEELEKRQPESSKIDALKVSALLLSRQIDDLRCARATEELAGLLAK